MVFLIATLVADELEVRLPKGRFLGEKQRMMMDDVVATIKQLEEQDNKVRAISERLRNFSTAIKDREYMLNLFMKKFDVDARKASNIKKSSQLESVIEQLNDNTPGLPLIEKKLKIVRI